MFVKELEITLENGMKISGELDLPERQGQWKTIILFHGSGPSDRHATVESMGGIVSRNFDLLSETYKGNCRRIRSNSFIGAYWYIRRSYFKVEFE